MPKRSTTALMVLGAGAGLLLWAAPAHAHGGAVDPASGSERSAGIDLENGITLSCTLSLSDAESLGSLLDLGDEEVQEEMNCETGSGSGGSGANGSE